MTASCRPGLARRAARLGALLGAAALAGCSTDDGARALVEREPGYRLAQRCVTVASAASGGVVIAAGGGDYALTSAGDAAAERFFVRPSALGRFLLYDPDRFFLAAGDDGIVRLAAPDERAEWAILEVAGRRDDRFTLVARAGDRRLVARDGALALVPRSDPSRIAEAGFVLAERPAEECTPFPEASLDAEVLPTFHEPRDPSAPVVGFADLHAHLGFPAALAGLALAGRTFHPYGIEHALGDCSRVHGPNGARDLLGAGGGAGGRHVTAGYPDFTDWPRRGTFTHMQAYHRWIERAYLGGLRLVVTLATGNRTFCQLLAVLAPNRAEGDCTPASEVALQTRYVYAIQDYVDAQAGGPGAGWFRVVTSAAEARAAIAADKLAVVLGVEYSELFDCREQSEGCTPAYVDAELDALRATGVRSVFPIHRFDNAFGGTRIQGGDGGAWMNLSSKISTGRVEHVLDLVTPGRLLLRRAGGHFWDVATCPDGLRGTGDLRSMPAFFDESFPTLPPPLDALFGTLLVDKLSPLPDYAAYRDPGARGCNPRGLTDVGRHLVNGLVDRGMIVEIDHLSDDTLAGVLDVLEARRYSGVVSSHQWLEDRAELRERVFALGGLMVPFNGNPSATARTLLRNAAEMRRHPFVAGVGTGTDIMGVAGQPPADGGITINYPFTSYDGTVRFLPPRTGNRSFDYATDGLAHYGLLPEWLENLRQVDERDGTDALDVLMRSAEAYLQMWERAEAAAVR